MPKLLEMLDKGDDHLLLKHIGQFFDVIQSNREKSGLNEA
jgi:hypothetical protein